MEANNKLQNDIKERMLVDWRSEQREVMTKAAISWLLFAGYLHNDTQPLFSRELGS